MTARDPGASEVFTVGPTRSPRATALRARRPAPTMTVGFDVLVHEVMAAMATDPWRRTAAVPPTWTATPPLSVAPVAPPSPAIRDEVRGGLGGRLRRGECGPEVRRQVRQDDPVLGPSRAGDRWRDRAEVEGQRLVEGGSVAGLAPQPLRLRVALDQVDLLGGSAGQAQVGERLVVDREQRRGRPELGAHVADGGPVGE